MGLADYTKKLNLKDIFIFILLTLITESTLLLAFMLEKDIRVQLWKYSLFFDFLCLFLFLINKILKISTIHIIATFFLPALRSLSNMTIVFIIYSIGFSYKWFSIVVMLYCLIWLFLLFPNDQLKKINTFFVESKIVKIILLILVLIAAFGNNRYAIRHKNYESINAGFLRFGISATIINYYWVILVVTSMKDSIKIFENRKLELEERESEVVER